MTLRLIEKYNQKIIDYCYKHECMDPNVIERTE